jgi:hypothetical protein
MTLDSTIESGLGVMHQKWSVLTRMHKLYHFKVDGHVAMQGSCVHSYHAHAVGPSLMKGMLDLLPLFLICLKKVVVF